MLNFGAPTNEAEEYFYNAGMEVLNQGGFLHAAKIPYSNDIAGIYAAAKYKITTGRGLYRLDEEAGMYYEDELDQFGEKVYLDKEVDQPGHANGRFYKNYRSLKEMGLNKLSLIAPAGQDFISKDLVEEYETGESTPGDDVIYLVDKTRAIYTRATEISDKQDNRDARACIGIVPVITTLCNTAYYQRKTTGLEADVPELYQPVRSLKTITFPAGAAAAAEYKPTQFQKSDLHTQLMSDDNNFQTSLSERAATIAQSCLVNGNLIDGKFKPFVCNDICVVVFKAFVSTEDGKIDFDVVETWVGSLDPKGRDEKGRTTFIDTIINNNSEYIYCFSNLQNPEQILNPDHGFVAGSDSEYKDVKDSLVDDKEYLAATLFSAYAARMLGFYKEYDPISPDSTVSLAVPEWLRDFTWETDESDDNPGGPKLRDVAQKTMAGLRQFYSQDAKQPVCTLDQLRLGGTFTSKEVVDKVMQSSGVNYTFPQMLGSLSVSDKFIVGEPSVKYLINRQNDVDTITHKPIQGKYIATVNGALMFDLFKKETDSSGLSIAEDSFQYDDYDYNMLMGKVTDDSDETDPKSWYDFTTEQLKECEHPNLVANFGNWAVPDITTQKLGELSILNSTDYLRAIYDFEQLVDAEEVCEGMNGITYVQPEDGTSFFDTPDGCKVRQACIQSLIVDSIERSGKFKSRLRYLKKAKINVDRLDLNFKWYLDGDSAHEASGKKYIEELYNAYNDMGLFTGISYTKGTVKQNSSDSSSVVSSNGETLEDKLDAIVNVDTTKKEKMNPRSSSTKVIARSPLDEFAKTLEYKYLRLKIYLNSQYYAKLADMYKVVTKILEDCCYAQQRYVESKRNTDDSNIMLGFYPEMAEPIITYTTIAQSLNKILDTMSDVHTSEIDVVCDAGISNIAQFVKQVYDPSADDGEDVGGLYDPVRSASYFKFNKNTDLAYWKTIVFKFDTFCKFRGDCMFCTESPRHMVLTGNKQVVRKTKKDTSVDLNILPYLSKIAGINTSYGAGYLNWYRTISDYTGDTLWVPPSIKAMGTYILTDKQYNWWDAPAGMRRGVINMVETSFNPTRVQAGEIYDVNWNYAIHYLNDGIIQEGQKTFQTRQSALDRVNVRRLIGRIKRYVYFASRQFLYESHTQATREKYVKTITPFFQDLVNRGGLYDFKIICDSSNNTPEVIDRNELRVKIGIKPVKAIEFIIIDLCTLNTGADWKEMDSI